MYILLCNGLSPTFVNSNEQYEPGMFANMLCCRLFTNKRLIGKKSFVG